MSTQINKQFLTAETLGGMKLGSVTRGMSGSFSAGDMYAMRFKCPRNTVVTHLQISHDSCNVGQIVMGIYSSTDQSATGLPGSLLAQATAQTLDSNQNGEDQQFALQTPVSLVAGSYYWIAVHANVVVNLFYNSVNVSAYSARSKYRSVAYSATMPASFGTPTGGWTRILDMAAY